MKILTANRLGDGEAVWLAADGCWIETMQGSEVVADKASEERLETAGKAAFDANLVVDVNLIDIEIVGGAVVPVRLRERIRGAGPTNRHDLGKQTLPGVDPAA